MTPSIERTAIGMQYVIPGTERIEKPKQRVFKVDVLVCEHCGGRRRVLTFLTDPPVLRAILEHLGLPADPPTVAPARPPPEPELPFS